MNEISTRSSAVACFSFLQKIETEETFPFSLRLLLEWNQLVNYKALPHKRAKAKEGFWGCDVFYARAGYLNSSLSKIP